MAETAHQTEGAPTRLTKGDTVGRFVIVGLVGRGGMGEVYAAYDPELDRKVAVKLLHARASTSDDGRMRLLREAQAIAKLSHPSVVVVYDVGTRDDAVFIAMEFVDGNTVGYWLQATRRSVRDVLNVFLAAGRGLAAAHEAGLVHRDFKPDNVMLTRDGQVRVMDFGLARATTKEDDQPPSESPTIRGLPTPAPAAGPRDAEDMLETRNLAAGKASAGPATGKYMQVNLTQAGAVIGTPAYMAPEQFSGERIDERSDQFSFCVALYEALYGQRPFAGKDPTALMANVLRGAITPAPPKSRVPAWLRRVLLRGLSVSPEARYPSMAALLTALQSDPAVRRNKWLTAAFLTAIVAAGALTAHRLGRAHVPMCLGGEARLEGIWEANGIDSPRKQKIHQAFARTGKRYAEQAFAGAARLLDQYVGRWVDLYTDACTATHVRGDQSADVLDLRMACLAERAVNLQALTDVFATADDGVVLNAVSAAAALAPLDRCANVPLLRAVVRPPEDAATRAKVEELRGQLARVIALRDSGQCVAAEAQGVSLLESVRNTKYPPLLADTLSALGYLIISCGDPNVALARLKEAYSVASGCHHDQTAAEAAVIIPAMIVNRLGQSETANDWLAIAKGAVERVGGNDRLQGWLDDAAGMAKASQQQYGAALADLNRALALKEKAQGTDHPDTISTLSDIGNVLEDAGRLDEALAFHERARKGLERVLGPEHPNVALVVYNECEVLNRSGRYSQARNSCLRALDIYHQAGADEAILSYPLTGLGLALLGEEHAGEAIAPLEEAVAVRVERTVRPDLLGESRFSLARALWSRPQERKRALTLAREARDDYAKSTRDPQAVAQIDAWYNARR